MKKVKEILKKEGWKGTDRNSYFHFETPKGILSQGFVTYDEAVLAYDNGFIIWRFVCRGQLSNLRMAAGGETRITKVIVDDILKEWVGIGWIGDEPPTPNERREYPIAID